MLTRSDIAKNAYLRLITAHLGYPVGAIGIAHTVGRDWAGQWFFQMRWLNRSPGKRNRPVSEWSLNLREEDLEDFELISSGTAQELLKQPRTPGNTRKKARQLTRPTRRWKRHPDQLRLDLLD